MTQLTFSMAMSLWSAEVNKKERQLLQQFVQAVLTDFAKVMPLGPSCTLQAPLPQSPQGMASPRFKRNTLGFDELMAVRGLVRFNAYMEGISENEMEAELCAYFSVPTITDIGRESLHCVMDYLWKSVHTIDLADSPSPATCSSDELLPLRGLLDFLVSYGSEGRVTYDQIVEAINADYRINNIELIRRKDLLKAMFLIWGKINSYCFGDGALSSNGHVRVASRRM